MNFLIGVLVGLLTIILGLGFIIFLRALSARLMTGKWPHEDARSQEIFRNLP